GFLCRSQRLFLQAGKTKHYQRTVVLKTMIMNWTQLLSLKKSGDTKIRERKNENPSRAGFEVDYDRIIFSNAFRSLQDKTQVMPLSKTDCVHTRLTHSLEVPVVGRSIGRLAGSQILEYYHGLAASGSPVN